MTFKFEMAQAIARRILAYRELFSPTLVNAATTFTDRQTIRDWRKSFEEGDGDRWQYDSISWKKIQALSSEWEGKL